MSDRLPSHIEAKALLRQAQSRGGFSMLLHRGDRDQGAILLVLRTFTGESSVCERLPQVAGAARWSLVNPKDIQTDQGLNEYLMRRVTQDPDLWTIELTVPEVERFVSDLSS
ncbi:DUF1491 family protein [Novosphingobium sp.]|uniref:DUF1491 family protein n=1 Tax=Novosphingobium sp. TaxID=1874826 RepID=UPI0025D30B6A|nr:DUF1491 family protein [Novosphingobium sp.]